MSQLWTAVIRFSFIRNIARKAARLASAFTAPFGFLVHDLAFTQQHSQDADFAAPAAIVGAANRSFTV